MDHRNPSDTRSIICTDVMDNSIVDKVCVNENNNFCWPASTDDNLVTSTTYDTKKMGNKFLFLTVEYIENTTKDFGRTVPHYEQLSLSSIANSPISEFEHQVSPLDPNMSSTARYSPTPVPLPLSPFQSGTIVQDSTEENTNVSKKYSSELIDHSSISQSENSSDFTDSEGLVSSVGSELILIPETNSELESSSTSLILPEIQESDLSLSGDLFEAQINCNVLNKTCSDDLSIADHIADSILLSELNKKINVQRYATKTCEQVQSVQNESNEMKFFSSSDINENNSWLQGANNGYSESEDNSLYGICMIADEPVPSRAVATLPGQYLYIGKIEPKIDAFQFGVFAKINICQKTQFGPVEGVLKKFDGSFISGSLPLLYKTKNNNEFLKIDVSDENSSNWMRFVRSAETFEEQNLVICQNNEGIIFLTTRNILAGEELRAGPSKNYARERNLPVLVQKCPDIDSSTCSNNKKEKDSVKVPIKSGTLKRIFKKQKNIKHSYLLQKKVTAYLDNSDKHLNPAKINSAKLSKAKINKQNEMEKENSLHDSSNEELEIIKRVDSESDDTNSYQCSTCSKILSTKLKLQQHCLLHSIKNNNDDLMCNICSKKFLNYSSVIRHIKIHQDEESDIDCKDCKETFDALNLQDLSDPNYKKENLMACPHCPRSFNNSLLIRRHIMTQHHLSKSYECHYCYKKFAAADKLKMHLLSHSDYREFQCANCDKKFKRKDKLKIHVTRAHLSQQKDFDQGSLSNCAKKLIPKADCDRFIYKCRRCQVGFKRRGMLVNHLAKRHPDVPPDSVPELCLPILRQTRDYFCQYCEKVYKSSSKRKAHIMKNHPGAALPPSNRSKELDSLGLPNPTYSQTVGSIKTIPQGCRWCHKQYASKAKLLQHQRKKHSSLMEPADQIPRPRSRPPQNQSQIHASAKSCSNITKISKANIAQTSNTVKQKICMENRNIGLKNSGLEALNSQFGKIRDVR